MEYIYMFDFSPIEVKIISVEKKISEEPTTGEYYEVETNIGILHLFGDSGRRDAKILEEEFIVKDKKAILNGCLFEQEIILPDPLLPIILNASQKDE